MGTVNSKKFRVPISATGSYTEFHGGTVADALGRHLMHRTKENEILKRLVSDIGDCSQVRS